MPMQKPYYSSIGHDFCVRFELDDLSRQDQLSLLHNLMQKTGTTAAIFTQTPPNGPVDQAIQAAWFAYQGGGK